MSALLEFIRFCKMTNWSVKTNLSSQINSKYKIVTLGKYIKEEKDKIKPFLEPNEDFKILGVNNKIGLFDNEIKKGKEINQAYKKVENGYLAYNPYRINVGSIGLKTKKQEFNLISPAYVVFSCSKILLPEYLYMLFKTNIFNNIIKESTRGSVRQILAYDILETLKIPLPDIETQKKIVQNYQEKLELAKKQEKEAEEKEREIEKYLQKELGIELSENNDTQILNFVRFKSIDRWDFLSTSFDINNIKSKYKFKKIKQMILKTQYGLSLKADLNSNNSPMLRMNNIQNGELNIQDLKYIKHDDKKIKNYILNKGDVLFNRTNSKELVGKCAVFKLDKIYTFASYLIRVKLNFKIVNPDYFVYILNSFIGRKQIDATSRQITGQVNINAEELKNFSIPLPNMQIQLKMVNYLQKIKNEIKNIKKQAMKNKKLALQEFEKDIFNKTSKKGK